MPIQIVTLQLVTFQLVTRHFTAHLPDNSPPLELANITTPHNDINEWEHKPGSHHLQSLDYSNFRYNFRLVG
jgi:hypothetical protein